MSINTGKQPRHIRDGKYTHECAYCGVNFRDNNMRTKYCSFEHKNAANNRSYYERNRRSIIMSVMLRRYRKQSKPKKESQDSGLEQMSNEEILEYVRNNPHAVRVRRR